MPFDPRHIEAQLAMGLIASSSMPELAWDALEASLDGPAIRRLAALNHPTAFEVGEVLPRAMQEMGIARIAVGEAARRIAKHIVAEILAAGVDPMDSLRELESLWIRSDYVKELQEIGTLNDDVWIWNSFGDKEIRRRVTKVLETFLAS